MIFSTVLPLASGFIASLIVGLPVFGSRAGRPVDVVDERDRIEELAVAAVDGVEISVSVGDDGGLHGLAVDRRERSGYCPTLRIKIGSAGADSRAEDF
jgi:hypothetical protein